MKAAGIFIAVARFAASLLDLLNLKARRKEREEAKARAEEPVKAAEEIRQAVAEGNEAKVNEILAEANNRKRHGGGVGKAVSVALAALALGGSMALHSGCALIQPKGKTIVLAADRRVVKMELDGIPGWFVPEAQFADMAAAYVAEAKRMELREAAMGAGE